MNTNERLAPLLDLPPAEQYDIAFKLAENIGYVLSASNSDGRHVAGGMQTSATEGAITQRPAHPMDTISGGPIGPSESAPVSAPIDWSRPLETSERMPRPVRVLGEHRGVVEYVDVLIEGGGDFGSHWHHPPGEYCAEKTSGMIRGKLAIRNVAAPGADTRIMGEAANQIERLRFELKAARIEIEIADAEIERLKALRFTSLQEMVQAIDSGAIKIDSPNIGGGDPEVGYEPHYWIDEWLHHARRALALSSQHSSPQIISETVHRGTPKV